MGEGVSKEELVGGSVAHREGSDVSEEVAVAEKDRKEENEEEKESEEVEEAVLVGAVLYDSVFVMVVDPEPHDEAHELLVADEDAEEDALEVLVLVPIALPLGDPDTLALTLHESV